MARDPYQVLGVSKTASEAEIKKAFRSLAKKHHPDTKGGDPAAQKRFQEISAAYDVVGDKDKRKKYDAGEIDEAGNPRGFDPRQGGGFQGDPFGFGRGGRAQGSGPGDYHFTWTNEDSGDTAQGFRAEDIFSDLFGGLGGGRRGGGARAPRRGQDFAAQATVSFDEAANGGTRRVSLQNGEQIDVKIPPGLKDGQQIRLKSRGGAGANGGTAGDVLLSVSVAPHPFFTRDGNNLKMDLPITLKEATLGGKVPVPTLTGAVQVTIPPGSNSGSVLRLKGKGIPAHGGEAVGDLYVKLVVALPDTSDPELKKFVESWDAVYDPRAKLRS
jgi:DnaJ-class molecular chaperone